MFRLNFAVRPNWRKSIEKYGYLNHLFQDAKVAYWVEQLEQPFCFHFTPLEVNLLYRATRALHHLCLAMVEKIVESPNRTEYLRLLKIPEPFWSAIAISWQRESPEDHYLYGRFDLILANDQVKVLEFNADTPTFLWECVYQWIWFEDLKKEGILPTQTDQFNSIDISLKQRFKTIGKAYALDDSGAILHFLVTREAPEDVDTVLFMMSMAHEVGITSKLVYLDEFGIDQEGYPVDADGWRIFCLFKLYPWENLFTEIAQLNCWGFVERLKSGQVRVIEPLWKSLLSNKGIWALLWQEFPLSRYLLPTYFEEDSSKAAETLRQSVYVRKPLLGREGASVSIIDPDPLINTLQERQSDYGQEGFILQQFCPPPDFAGYYPVIGSWFIDDACGMGVRADKSLITGNSSLFVPHYFGRLLW